ncbi:MAG: tetratricopeptide repeat protein [Bryobacteraceae bacterium]
MWHTTSNVTQRAWFLTLYIAFCLPSYSQFLPNLQAKTPAEYDAYLDVLDGPVLKNGAAFERNFPQSTLRLPVCELIAREWRAKGDREQAIAAAERGLAVAPDYIPLLVEVADLLANGSERLDRAAQAAQYALELLERVKAPLRIGPEDWTAAVAKLRSRAYSALGMVRFKRDDLDGAMRSFQSALAAGAADDPILHYRLGRLYAVSGNREEARRELEQVASSPDSVLRDLAKKALAELK